MALALIFRRRVTTRKFLVKARIFLKFGLRFHTASFHKLLLIILWILGHSRRLKAKALYRLVIQLKRKTSSSLYLIFVKIIYIRTHTMILVLLYMIGVLASR